MVTVGLSLSIPLALLGQMLLNSQTSSFVYWIGAALILVAFLLVTSGTKDSETVHLAGEPETPSPPNELRQHGE